MNFNQGPEVWSKLAKELGVGLGKVFHILKLLFLWIRFLQIPIAAGLAAAGLAYVAWRGIGPAALVRGAYDGESGLVFWVAGFASFFGIALWDISRVIIKYGPERFRLAENERCSQWLTLVGQALLAVKCAAVPVLTALACNSAGRFTFKDWAAWIICPLVLVALYGWITFRKHQFLVKLIARFGLLADGLPTRYPGYVYVTELNGVKTNHGLAAGHLRQGLLFVLSLVFVQCIGYLPTEALPAVVYVLVALLGIAWLLSGLGFFLIYYRIPLFLVVLAWMGLGSLFFHKAYTYRVVELRAASPLPNAQEVMAAPYAEIPGSEPSPPPITRRIAVAAVGGGIHSGAWAVEVLTRLQELEGGENIHKRICLLSGTSGGAYGAMHYAHAMYGSEEMAQTKEKTALNSQQFKFLADLRSTVQKPSLGAVVRSLAYDDLPGYLLPQFSPLDRGNAMERQWANNAGGGLENSTLAQWAERALRGRMPAVMFTSGAEESGRPIVYGSSEVSDWNWNARQTDKVPLKCEGHLVDYTIPVVTGARLSASFPYVSPAARPDAPSHTLRRVEHQMDGGYYDNYGIVALNRWIHDGLMGSSEEFLNIHPKPTNQLEIPAWMQLKQQWFADKGLDRILVIQIRYQTESEEPIPEAEGFNHQLAAPLNGLVSSRVAGQSLRSDQQFDLFCRYWAEQGVKIENARFDFHGDAALSWHLTPSDKMGLLCQGKAIRKDYLEYIACRRAFEPRPDDDKATLMRKEIGLKQLDKDHPNGSSAWRVMNFISPQ